MSEPSFIDRLIAQLDSDQPRWYLEWATSNELLKYSSNCETITYQWERLSNSGLDPLEHLRGAKVLLKQAVAQRLFHRILNASISANIMKESDQ